MKADMITKSPAYATTLTNKSEYDNTNKNYQEKVTIYQLYCTTETLPQ